MHASTRAVSAGRRPFFVYATLTLCGRPQIECGPGAIRHGRRGVRSRIRSSFPIRTSRAAARR